MEWYYYKDGDIAGPKSSEDIIGLINSGELRSDDLVYKNGNEDWIEIGLSDDFRTFAEQSAPVVQHMDTISEKEWIVLKQVNVDGEKAFKQLGPFSTSSLKSQLRSGAIAHSDFCWKNGMENWENITELSEFSTNEEPTIVTSSPVEDSREVVLSHVLREEDFVSKKDDEAQSRPTEPTTEDLALQFSNEMSDFVRSNTWDLTEDDVSEPVSSQLPDKANLDQASDELGYRQKESERIFKRWGEISVPKPVEFLVQGVGYQIKYQSGRLSENLASHLRKNPIKGLTKKVGKESLIVIMVGLLSVFGVSLYWLNSQQDRDSNQVSKIIDNSVQKNGLEIEFKAPKLAGRSMEMKIADDGRRILSTNPIKKTIRIVLDNKGEATVRLDQMGLPDGYYKFTATVGLTEQTGEFFVGEREGDFENRLSQFREKRRALKKQAEKPIVTPKAVPKELKDFYKFSRELESGHAKLKADPIKWSGFYQQWGKRFYSFKSSQLERLKEDLKSEKGIERQIDQLSGSLEKMSLDMDLSVRYGGGKQEFDEISTNVSQVIEKVRDTK